MHSLRSNHIAQAAGEVARILDEAGIPNILWGFAALGLVGQVKDSNDIDFIVSDELLQKAADTLIKKGFRLCTQRKCPYNEERARARALAAVHFDCLKGAEDPGPLQLFPKSHILWWLKEIPAGAPAHDDEDLMLTNDTRLPPKAQPKKINMKAARDLYQGYEETLGPCGPWKDTYPIKILNPSSFTEAVLWLYCRDYHNEADQNALQLGFDDHWKRLILPLGELKEDPQNIVKKTLRKDFDEAWKNFNQPRQPYCFEYFNQDLREKLKKQNRLPAFPGIFRLYQ